MARRDDPPLFAGGETVTALRVGDPLWLRAPVIRLEIVAGPDAGRAVDLAAPSSRVGSGRDCDLVIGDPTVSRHHLDLAADPRGVRVTDAGSHNGTWVDGLRVFDALARADSAIVIGKTTLRLQLSEDTVEIPLSPHERFGGLLGASVPMRRLFSILERVAVADATVLIEAETGTGKELAAEAIHDASPRANGPFVVFDCSAVSASLVESELFGHVKGAFTGASADRAGALEAADGGTLFLDEIGELPLELQPKLLRALEQREVRRIGANTRRKVDIRVVAATHRSLLAEVDRGRFREDLYYRLAVVRVAIPPLRERPDDIPILVRHLARGRGVPDAALAALMAQAWPGNVRELRNTVERSLSLGFPAAGPAPTPAPAEVATAAAVDLSVPLKDARDRLAEEFEKAYLRAALAQTGGNATRAAVIAGVSRKFVQRAIDHYRLRDDD